MRIRNAANVLEKLIPQGEPLLLTGAPGVGKTDLISDVVCNRLKFKLHIFHPVLDDRVDYKGLPGIVDGKAEFLTFGNLRILEEATEPTVIFFDDLGSSVGSDIQAAVMQLIHARELNGKAISDHITFVAATNRKEDRAGVSGLLAPLQDRFIAIIPVDFHIDDWAAWMMQKGFDPRLVGFARLRTNLMMDAKPSKGIEKIPTPRSVAGVGRLLNQGLGERELLACAVGEAWATEFAAFCKVVDDIPDVNKIWKKPEKVKVPKEAAVLYALMAALAFHAKEENVDALMVYLNRVSPEYAVVALKDCAARLQALGVHPGFFEWIKVNNAVFDF